MSKAERPSAPAPSPERAKKKTSPKSRKTQQQVELKADVWLHMNGEKFGGKQRLALLAAVAETGSITQAAKQIDLSYKAAWDAIEQMNNLAGEPLLERAVGGKGGGGTRLTVRGQQLVDNFRIIEQEQALFLQRIQDASQGLHHLIDEALLIKKMNMKTSIRNQYRGVVSHIKTGAVNDEITVRIAGAQDIIAIITHDSTLELELDIGSEVFALVSPSSIVLMEQNPESTQVKLSARNRLTGKISRISKGAINTDISITLAGGAVMSAVITNESCEEMQLKKGQQVQALFKASSVILGVAV